VTEISDDAERRFPEVEEASFAIPGGPLAPARARHAVDELIETWTADFREKTMLLVSELVTNSVRHAATGPADAVGLVVSISAIDLRVEVLDGGPGFDRPVRLDGEIEGGGGLGLRLVDQIADRWGVQPGQRTRVWFELDREPRLVS
jgi:anti-sigma regulatory factor (Ser/Thr protein kinase)